MSGKQFIYENVRVDENLQKVSFDYSIVTDNETYSLCETLTLPVALPQSHTVDRLLRALHIALGISYYKTFIPPEINHAYSMDAEEATFWNTVFSNGLGEFLYKNKLSRDSLATFSAQEGTVNPEKEDDIQWQEKALLGIGGGKDSIVAGELLKELAIETTGFVLATGENRGQSQAVADTMGIALLGVERQLDQQILTLNTIKGAYNGHVPISLVFALIGSLLACSEASKYVIVANEASASIPHATHEGASVNHQWSKSLEFEKLFQSYVHTYISPTLTYTSIIRPLTSVAVAKIFAGYPQYFEVFTSDNSLFKITQQERSHPRWSDDSPKSLSSYILLAPWLSDEALEKTFGQDFLNKKELEELFLNLLGRGDTPVLDCVGTPDELRVSLSLLASQDRSINSAMMQTAKIEQLLLGNFQAPLAAALEIAAEDALPPELKNKVIEKLKEKLA